MLRFIRKAVEVPSGYSKEDLIAFRNIALRNYPLLVPLIDDYLRLAEESDTESSSGRGILLPGFAGRSKSRNSDERQMHLFDMLREKKLFPSNADLSDFAGRILPDMRRYRFEKMSRGDIATRIIEYLETLDRKTREKLEVSMREAMLTGPRKPADRKSFLSEWEKIIKGIPL
jgi:hypothetical protein